MLYHEFPLWQSHVDCYCLFMGMVTITDVVCQLVCVCGASVIETVVPVFYLIQSNHIHVTSR